jgi:hypothetical protein
MPTPTPASPETLSDHELVRSLETLLSRERQLEADVIAHLSEIDARRIYLEEGFSSLFRYCTERLHLSEAVAYDRILVARRVRAFPTLLERIRAGDLHLSGARLLVPHLTTENHRTLVERARHRTKREIEEIVADLVPKPDARASVRRLPGEAPSQSSPPADSGGPAQPAPSQAPGAQPALSDAAAPPPAPSGVEGRTTRVVGSTPRSSEEKASPATAPRRSPEPLGAERYKVQFTASRALCDKLREAQALLGHQIPDGDLGEIFSRALDLLVAEAKRKRFAQTSRPKRRAPHASEAGAASARPSRHVPAWIKRAVAERDAQRCTFVARSGRRCDARERLEFHHLEPWARAHAHSVDRITLRCSAHNRHAAERDFGRAHMDRCSRRGREGSTRTGTSWGARIGSSSGARPE